MKCLFLLVLVLFIVNIISIQVIPIPNIPKPNDNGSSGSSSNNNDNSSGSSSNKNDNSNGSSNNNNNDNSSGSSNNNNNGDKSDDEGGGSNSFKVESTFIPTLSPTVRSYYTTQPSPPGIPTLQPTHTPTQIPGILTPQPSSTGSPTLLPTTVRSAFTNSAPTLSPTYTRGSPTPLPSFSPTYLPGSPTPKPTSTIESPQTDGNIKKVSMDSNVITMMCNRDDSEWLNLYLSKSYKTWLVALIVIWAVVFIYSFYKIYAIYSLIEVRYGTMSLNVFRYGFVGFAASMRVVELSILVSLKSSSATCVEFSFTKNNDSFTSYNSSQVPFIVLTHAIFYPSILIVAILRHKLTWIQFKRIFDSHNSKSFITVAIENYGLLIAVVFVLMVTISFAGPISKINDYAIATQIVCPIITLMIQLYKCFVLNPFNVSSQIDSGWSITTKNFERIIALDLIVFSVFAIITTRSFLFNYPWASMITYSITLRVLEASLGLLLSFNLIQFTSLRKTQVPHRISNSEDDDESSISIFVNDDLPSEMDTRSVKLSKKKLLSSKSHQGLKAVSYSPHVDIPASTKQVSRKERSPSSSTRSNYSALYSTSLLQNKDTNDTNNSISL